MRRNDIIDTLARTIHDPAEARSVVAASGFPMSRAPSFHSPQVFWSRIVGDIEGGVMDSLRPLLEAAYASTGSTDILALMSGADERVQRIAGAMSRLFTDETASQQMAARAGFPRSEIPSFRTPHTFWTDVVTSMAQGVAPLDQLLEEARRRLPYNPEIVACHESVRRSPIRPAVTSSEITIDEAIARSAQPGAKAAADAVLAKAISDARAAVSIGDMTALRRALGM